MGSKEKNMDLTSIQGEAVLNDVLQDNSTDKVSEKNHLEKKSSAKTVSKKDKWADKPAMEVRDLHFSYGKNKVLKGVSLKIEEGKITTIMGANG